MNDTIETVMSFINENTTILILICVFLIIVLMAYLIDNSVKSRKIKKNINNETKEIKKKIEEDRLNLEQAKINEQFENAIKEETQIEEIKSSDAVIPMEVLPEIKDEAKIEPDTIFDTNINNNKEEIISIDNILPKKEKILDDTTEKEVEVIYKNDKKLSEILFDNIEKQPEGKLDETIIKQEQPKEEKSIDNMNDSASELDAIMRKLNNMDNKVEDDKYTNIF